MKEKNTEEFLKEKKFVENYLRDIDEFCERIYYFLEEIRWRVKSLSHGSVGLINKKWHNKFHKLHDNICHLEAEFKLDCKKLGKTLRSKLESKTKNE
jgi:hypothetical protein